MMTISSAAGQAKVARCNVEQMGSPLDLYEHPVGEFVTGSIGSPKGACRLAQTVPGWGQSQKLATIRGPRPKR